jgi:hypothetical protein
MHAIARVNACALRARACLERRHDLELKQRLHVRQLAVLQQVD